MRSAVHPITQRLLDGLLVASEEGLDRQQLKVCANLVLDTPDGRAIGVELIALARRLASAGSTAISGQLLVLAGLALGDSAGASIAALDARPDSPAIPKFRSSQAPAGAVPGGPLARLAAEAKIESQDAAESACPFHRLVAKVSKKRKVTI